MVLAGLAVRGHRPALPGHAAPDADPHGRDGFWHDALSAGRRAAARLAYRHHVGRLLQHHIDVDHCTGRRWPVVRDDVPRTAPKERRRPVGRAETAHHADATVAGRIVVWSSASASCSRRHRRCRLRHAHHGGVRGDADDHLRVPGHSLCPAARPPPVHGRGDPDSVQVRLLALLVWLGLGAVAAAIATTTADAALLAVFAVALYSRRKALRL